MRVGLTSVAAGAAILVLLSAGFALSVRSAALHRSEQARNTAIDRVSRTISAEAHQLDLAARRALEALRAKDDFAAARSTLANLRASQIDVEALASFEPRQGAQALRRAETLRRGAAPAPILPEQAMALRREALFAARRAQKRLASNWPQAILVPSDHVPETEAEGSTRRFWLILGGDGARSIAVRASLPTTYSSGSDPAAPIAQLSLIAAPASNDDAGSDLASPRLATRLGDHLALLTPDATPAPAATADYLTALENFLPSLACAFLLGGLFLAHARRVETRAAEAERRNAEMLASIEAKQAELKDSQERFQHLAESTNVIPWTADLANQRFVYIGPQIHKLTGFSADDWRASGFWAQHVHPSDRQRVLVDEIPKIANGSYKTIDYRIRGANGRILHVRNMLSVDEEVDEQTGRSRPVARGFLLDVTEMRRVTAALNVARRSAEEANKVKSEFLASMSHELRTPLNAVIGFSEIMKNQLFGPLDERYREYSESVHSSGKHLLSLINDVLDLSKIEAGRVELSDDAASAVDMLSDCRTLLQERVHSAGLRCTLNVSPDLPAVRMDERRMKQVILNLVANAIKFTDPGGEIEIGAERRRGHGMRLWVRDTGCGMSEEEIPKALAKFGQVDGDLDRQHQGTGLGLPIAKSLVELHGGTLQIRSRKGEGALILLQLPEERIVEAAAKSGTERVQDAELQEV